jgi:NAD(P)-dependent dehydrogenase (short-subunit alcohol dehydrogenase family)
VSARVLITGAGAGIGAAAAAKLRDRGARVLGIDLEAGDDVLPADVRDQESVDRAVAEAVERLGGLDVLVNNAGVGYPQSAGTAPDDDALAILDVNLLGPWRVTAAALEALRESAGRVINVASGLAIITIPFAPAYCMSKRGLVAYSDALRLEHGDWLTVTTVYPGYIRTAIHDRSRSEGVALEGAIPAERLQDAARTIARAALGPPRRDLATSLMGTIAYAAAARGSRRLVDRVTLARLRRLTRSGHFEGSELTREWVGRANGR